MEKKIIFSFFFGNVLAVWVGLGVQSCFLPPGYSLLCCLISKRLGFALWPQTENKDGNGYLALSEPLRLWNSRTLDPSYPRR